MRQHEIMTPRRARLGFSLVETLVALLIVTMLTTIVANGIPVAKRTFESVRDKSNAQVALATTTAALRNELGLALDVQESSGVWYYQDASGAWVRINTAENGTILRKEYYQNTSTGFTPLKDVKGDQIVESLIPKKFLPDGLTVTFSFIRYDPSKGYWIVKDLCIHGAGGHDLAWIGEEDGQIIQGSQESQDNLEHSFLVRAVL